MYYHRKFKSNHPKIAIPSLPGNQDRKIRLGLFLILMCCGGWILSASSADAADSKLQIKYQDRRLTIAAENADIKTVLSKIAEKANILIRIPNSITKRITCNKQKASLKEALQSLLKGMNHAIIYQKQSQTQSRIAKVLVYPEATLSTADINANRRLDGRIRSYERQIESLKNRLSKVDQNSARGKNYTKRIRGIEQKIERLERQRR